MGPQAALLIIASYFDLRRTFFIDRDHKTDRPATHLTVFNVFLITRRAVDQQRDPLSAIGAFNFYFIL